MKVILRQDVESLGRVGEIVNVKDGYARNYLIPRNYAYYATAGAMKAFEAEKKRYLADVAKVRNAAQGLAAKLAEVQVSIAMKVGEEGRLFGSATPQMIADNLAEQGFTIDRRTIMIDEPIKTLGVYDVNIKLHTDVTATVKVWIISE
ncbi:50S ribosomal protein L9 [Ignavibacteria bacterium]|nr:50S ribosomal protein L9 [Bacteroidota bacterium]